MNMEFGYQIVQIPKITITQKLILHLEILQMPRLDIVQQIEEMLKINPILEYGSSENSLEENLDIYINENAERNGEIQPEDYQDRDGYLSYAGNTASLRESLKLQLLELKISPFYKKIACFLIENTDADGYLREDIKELACFLKISEKTVTNCLKMLQCLEPAGVCARDLQECLILQLKRKKLLCRNAEFIILHYFELLAGRHFLKISRETGMEKEEVERIYSMVKSLNPKPGNAFQKNDWEQYIVPDLFLREINGSSVLQFNTESIPPVGINEYYVKLLKNPESDHELKNYIRKNLSSAVEFMKAIRQREQTIMQIAHSILEYQEDFFTKGSEYLKPLNMKKIADKLGINVSTVSRAVNGKYIQTPRGIYELKFFFSATLETESEIEISAAGVKELIRRIILDENKAKPLSDEQIKEKLLAKGIKVARRTVAKYREGLSILPAAMRTS